MINIPSLCLTIFSPLENHNIKEDLEEMEREIAIHQ
jgi:hypothetical protein